MESNTQSYNIVELFYSIQGEGFYVGKPAIFIRFSGCNLSCDFCDEPLHKLPGKKYEFSDINAELQKYHPCKFVILTGGEPTIQPHFDDLVQSLQEYGYFVAVETNGTERITCTPNWIAVSPKTDQFYYGDELKLVYEKQDLDKYEKLPFKHFYLQPKNYDNELNPESVKDCLEVLKTRTKWSLSLQLHKAIGVE